MAISWEIDPTKGQVSLVISGQLGDEELMATVKSFLNDPAYKPGMPILSNHLELKSSITPAQMAAMINYLKPRNNLIVNMCCAIVTTRLMSKTMVSILSALSHRVPASIRAFSTVAEAQRWLDATTAGPD